MIISFNVFDENNNIVYSDTIHFSVDEDPIEKVKNYVKDKVSYRPIVISGVINKDGSLSLFTVGIDN